MYIGEIPTIFAVSPFIVIAYLLFPAWRDMARRIRTTVTQEVHHEDWTFVSSSCEKKPSSRSADVQRTPIAPGGLIPTAIRCLLVWPTFQILETLFLTLVTLVSAHHSFWHILWVRPTQLLTESRFFRYARAYEILSGLFHPESAQELVSYDRWQQEQAFVGTLDRVMNRVLLLLWACCILYMLLLFLYKVLSSREEDENPVDKKKDSSRTTPYTASIAALWRHVHRTLANTMKPLRMHLVVYTCLFSNYYLAKVTTAKFYTQPAVFYEAFLIYLLVGYSCFLTGKIVFIVCTTTRSQHSNNQHTRNFICKDLVVRVGRVIKSNEFRIFLWWSVVGLLLLYMVLWFQAELHRFDPYNTLQVSRDANFKDIKRAYRNLSLVYRPGW